MKRICLVVLNYQTYELTIRYVKDVLKQKNISVDVIIVDNASPNKSYENLASCFHNDEKVQVVLSPKNGGYSFGNNIGIKEALGRDFDYIFISNNDVIWKNNDDLYKLVRAFEEVSDERKDLAFFSALMKDSNGQAFPAWDIPSIYYDIAMFIPFLNAYFKQKYSSELSNSGVDVVEVIPGSFFGGKPKTFRDIGYLDENVFLYCEERILAKKVFDKGLCNAVFTDISYIHDSSSTIDSVFSKRKKMKEVFSSVNYYHSINSKNNYLFRFVLRCFQYIYLMKLKSEG